jgi:hypothetical protein
MLGIDVGTTNSSVARADEQGAVQLVQFPAADALVAAYRSLLYLEHTKTKTRSQLHSWSGPEGIERYLAAEPKGRLIQSLKSYLSSRTLPGTEVFGPQTTSGGSNRTHSGRPAQARGKLFRLPGPRGYRGAASTLCRCWVWRR